MKKFISVLSSLCLTATSLAAAFPASITADAVSAEAGNIVYDLVPNGKDYTLSGNYNVVQVDPGEELTINWIVSNDAAEIGGLEFTFDTSKVKVNSTKRGNAYTITPNVTLDPNGSFTYVFATDKIFHANDGAVIHSLNVTAPAVEGSYSIGLKSGENQIAAGHEKGSTWDYTFHGITLKVGNAANETTQSNPTPTGDGVIYDLVPSGKNYTFDGKNNVVKASAGEEISVQWIVNNDAAEVGGLEFTFDTSKVGAVTAAKRGNAYTINPNINFETAGQVTYVFATDKIFHAADGAVIMTMTLTAPTAEGNYTIGLKSGENQICAGHEKGSMNAYTFHGLTISVGESVETTTTTTPQPTGDEVVYDLIPSGKDYTFDGKNNVVKAAAGEEITVQWTVKNDAAEVGGLEFTFDTSKVGAVTAAKRGNAYTINPNINYETAGQVTYVFATDKIFHAADGAVIMSMTLTAPTAEGNYTIGLKSGENQICAGHEKGSVNPYVFHGLTISVGESVETTTTTTTTPKPTGDEVVYDLIASGKTNTFDGKNNVAKVAAGEKVTVQWTVKNDAAEVGGLEFTFDTSKVGAVTAAKRGSAYTINPNINYETAGQVTYVFATDKIFHAADGAVIMTMDVTAPTAEGSYTIGLKAGENQICAGHEKGSVNPYVFHGLTLVVGESTDTTTTTTTTTPEPTGDEVVYDLIASGKTNTFDGTNNVAQVTAGEKVTVQWTVKNDAAEVGGLEFTFDTSKVGAVTAAKRGSAYTINPNINYETAGQVTYVFATDKIFHAADGAVIMTMEVSAPTEKGKYTIGLKAGENQICAGHEKGSVNPYVFHGLTLEVVDEVTTTTTTESTTTTTTTSSEPTPAGKSNWTIDTKTVAAGEKVALPVIVKGDEGTAGFVVKFKYDSALTFDGFSWGDQYTKADDTMLNKNDMVVVWANAKGTDEKADGDVLYLNFTAPSANGEYPVEFVELEVVNFDEQPVTVTKKNGAVIVSETTTTTQTTTSSEPTPGGKSNWTIDRKVVAAGEKVALPVIVTGDEGTAGFVVQFKYDSALTFDGFTWGDQYTKADDTMFNKNDMAVVWANAKGADEKADGDVLYLNFTAPSTNGEYPVEFVKLEVVNFDEQPVTVTQKNGAVIVSETTTTTQTTTSSEPTPGGKSNWTIDRKVVAAGEKVALPVIVTGDEGTAGFVVQFKYDPALTFEGFTWGDQYTKADDTMFNKNDMAVVWANAKGADEKADGDVLYLNFTAPSANGEYPVEFVKLEVVNFDEQPVTVTQKNGAVIVSETTTTTQTTTSSEPNPAGKANWTIDRKVVAAGEKVALPVIVTGDEGTAGFVVQFKYDPALTFEGFSWGDQYTKADDTMFNKNDMVVVWANAKGTDEKADGDVLYLNFIAPSADGEYPVEFVKLEVINFDEQPVTVTQKNGAVIVSSTTTTTSITTTTESTSTETTTTVSSTTESTTTQSTTTESTTTQSTTTESTTTQSTTTESTTTQSTTTESTTTQSTTTESTTTQSTTTESTTTQSTTTESTTTQSTTTESTTTQSTTTESTTTLSTTTESTTTDSTTTNSSTTESTTTTTDTNPIPAGAAIWDIDDVIGSAGTTVKVPVYVLSDKGTAGFTVQFDLPEGFKVTGMTWGDAYGNADQVMWNNVENVLVWADPEGKSQIAEKGSILAILDVLVPADAVVGTKYPITFHEGIDAHDGNNMPVEVTGLDGSITIAKKDTVAFEIEDTEGVPNSKVDIPVDMILDPGTKSFEITFDIPSDLVINGITYDPEYEANGTFTWDPDTKTLTWTKNDGSDFKPDRRHNIANINVTVPNADPGTKYHIDATSVKATGNDGSPLDYIFNGGDLTVLEPVITTTTESTTTTTDTTTTVSTTTESTTTDSTTTESTTTQSTTTESTTTQSTTTESTTTQSTTTESTTTQSTTTESTTTQSTTTQSTTTESTTTQSTTTQSTTTESTTTQSTTTESTTTQSTTTQSTTTESTTTSSTTTESTTTQSTTTESTTSTTITTVSGETSIVTSYSISFAPPTRVNYWSHDTRSFKESGGLKDMVATLTVYKYYVDANGVQDAEPFQVKSMEITAYTNPAETENSPKKVWDNETSASLGKTDWTEKEALDATHTNKYTLKAYYTYSADINDPDFDVNNGEPLELGDFKIYIGVKGDYNLDNHVKADDAQNTLNYYVKKLVSLTPHLNDDPELDGEDGLVFFLINVTYRDGFSPEDPMENPPEIQAHDAQFILKYYVDHLIQLDHDWEFVVGYDYLDYFYGDKLE